MSLQNIDIKISYDTYEDNIVKDFYSPALSKSKSYKRITGFFTPKFLDDLYHEIKKSVNKNSLYIKILCSPRMSDAEQEKIELGYDIRDMIRKSIINTIDEYDDNNEVLPVISKLIANKVLDIKFVLTNNNKAMFHDKKGVFTDGDGNKIAFRGSNNETIYGSSENYESFSTFNTWTTPEYVIDIESDFDQIWENKKEGLIAQDVSKEINETITKNIKKNKSKQSAIANKVNISKKYDLYRYQKEAVDSWINNNYLGLLEMATGTGKTITALSCLEYLSNQIDKLLTVIVLPQKDLVEQWEEDIVNSGATVIKCYSDNSNWKKQLRIRLRSHNLKDAGYIYILTTRGTFLNNEFQKEVTGTDTQKLLISDEVHSFGSDLVRKKYDEIKKIFEYRLGVSATPFRRSDSETQKIINLFDKTVFSYTLSEAIENGYLNNYDYKPKILYFDKDSLESYREVYYDYENEFKKSTSKATNIIKNITSTIINSSTKKVEELEADLRSIENNLQGIVYTSPGKYNDSKKIYDESHIDYVSKRIGNLENIRLRKIRSQVSGEERLEILNQYRNKELNMLVAIKCLDQGINLKGVTHAFILSSTDSETEFIQRRGRILRKEEGKPKSKIVDYVMLPQDIEDPYFVPEESDVYIIIRELKRMKSYKDGSDNEIEIDAIIEYIEDYYYEYLKESEYEFI